MKKVLFVLFSLMLTVGLFAQNNELVKVIEGKYEISNIERVEGLNKDALFKNAVLWISEYYKSPEGVIEINDKENGILTITGIYSYIVGKGKVSMKIYIKHKLQFQFKDGRYKWIISDLQTDLDNKWRNIEKIPRYNKFDEPAKSTLYSDLEDYIKSFTEKIKISDDW